MRLGRVVVAALAIEILAAAETSISTAKAAVTSGLTAGLPDSAGRELSAIKSEVAPEVLEARTDDGSEPRGEPCLQQMQTAHLPTTKPVGLEKVPVLPAVYGEPLALGAMAHAPTNEDGVLFLFGVLAAELGFRIERVQRAFPDIEAKREVVPGRWELQLWELEWCSRNFKEHRHDPAGCHGIICWKHNWPDVPEGLEVIELSKVVKGK